MIQASRFEETSRATESSQSQQIHRATVLPVMFVHRNPQTARERSRGPCQHQGRVFQASWAEMVTDDVGPETAICSEGCAGEEGTGKQYFLSFV